MHLTLMVVTLDKVTLTMRMAPLPCKHHMVTQVGHKQMQLTLMVLTVDRTLHLTAILLGLLMVQITAIL